MTTRTRPAGAWTAVLLLLAALTVSPAPTRAEAPGPASVAPPPAADAPQIEHFEYWRGRGDAARVSVETARKRLDEANRQVRHMQRRNHPRGEARRALRDEQAQARAAWEAAVYHLEVELVDQAQEAGANPRWLRGRG